MGTSDNRSALHILEAEGFTYSLLISSTDYVKGGKRLFLIILILDANSVHFPQIPKHLY